MMAPGRITPLLERGPDRYGCPPQNASAATGHRVSVLRYSRESFALLRPNMFPVTVRGGPELMCIAFCFASGVYCICLFVRRFLWLYIRLTLQHFPFIGCWVTYW